MIIEIDDFLQLYPKLKSFEQSASFEDEVNPYDGVVYPLIVKDLPEDILAEVRGKLTIFLGREPQVSASFLRRSPKGVPVPHIAHTDKSMGDYSLMLYLNNEHGGTAFLRHAESGIMYQPEAPEFAHFAAEDQNDLAMWKVNSMAYMKENKAVIFDAGLFHCAMPIGGFGEGNSARTVLTVFFS